MSPKPFVDQQHTTSQYEPHAEACPCPPCTEYRQQHPQMSWAPIRRALLLSIPIWICLCILGLLIVHSAQAREGGIKPIPAPPALLKARAACPDAATIPYCRSALRKAYAAIAWQRLHARRLPASSLTPIEVGSVLAKRRDWIGREFACLAVLWNRESGWRPSAVNRDSGAGGIPQALPASKMRLMGRDWRTNPATQIRWGLAYIAGAYGSPCAALAHSNEHGWY